MLHNSVNRIEYDLQIWDSHEKKLDRIFRPQERQGRSFDKARYQYYRSVHRRYAARRKELSGEEKQMLRYLRDALKVQRKDVYKGWWRRNFHRLVNLIGRISDRITQSGPAYTPGHYDLVQQQRQQNMQQIRKVLSDHGMEQAIPEVERQMRENAPSFTVPYSVYVSNGKTAEYHLHINKVDDDGIYQFEKYDAHLRFDKNPSMNRSQQFRVVDDKTLKADQALNLLEGWAIEQPIQDANGKIVRSWVQLNFNERDGTGAYRYIQTPSHAFDLEKAAHGLPIRELNTPASRRELFDGLRAGKVMPVKVRVGVQDIEMYAVAAPQDGRIKILNQSRDEVPLSELPRLAQTLANQQSQSNQQGPSIQPSQSNQPAQANAPQLYIDQNNSTSTKKLDNKKPLVRKVPNKGSTRRI
ncbi:hypothetical protein [Chitinophaga tropicalis]|uniref:DUF3945 domain-containing protein n=1 Tax=Chitinophaga tropicalis TaxID=2683588 RepID=A0A7K1U019_9BACT|nr:hypothetical protein [Chitinophaga tropicalis]MVT07693.1 hypothetical protein [Chitinophaga tropicalis]